MSITDEMVRLVARATLERLTPKPPSPYVTDPVAWVRDKLGEHLWSKQRQIAESVRDNRYTAVQSCHDAGKSFVASRIVAHWLSVHAPGDAFAVTTAPTAAQVSAILWREIRRAHRKGKLDGYITSGAVPEWKLPGGEPIGYGRKPADEDQAAFQGIHARYPLIVVDEAGGVPRNLFDAVDALATNDDARVLAIGNPDDPASHFATICKPGSGWNVIRIDGLQTPNFTAEAVAGHRGLAALFDQLGLEPSTEVVPDGLRPLLLSPLWVAERIDRWGIESPLFTAKVRGDFPDIGDDVLIGPALIRAAQERTLEKSGRGILGVDVARFGADRTVIYLRNGPVLRLFGEYAKQATTETAGRVVAAKAETGADEIRVDGVGVGAGVVDQLAEQSHAVLDMQAGAKAQDPQRFANARAEWAWTMREALESGDVDLDPDDDQLAAQLGSIKFTYTSRGQIQIESKQDMRKRGLPSPDRADAAILAMVDPLGADLFAPLRWRWFGDLPQSGIAGQVSCASRVYTLAETWTYATAWLPSVDEGDLATVAVWSQTMDGNLLLRHVERGRVDEAAALIAPVARRLQADTVFVDRKQLTPGVRAELVRTGVSVTEMALESDRMARVLPASARHADGKIWLPSGAPWAAQVVAECRSWPHGRHIGTVEALALAVRVEATKWAPILAPPAPREPEPPSLAHLGGRGGDIDFMTEAF